jgi:hypothetical protein
MGALVKVPIEAIDMAVPIWNLSSSTGEIVIVAIYTGVSSVPAPELGPKSMATVMLVARVPKSQLPKKQPRQP